ncbi:GNAT family N-acetyltransferase [Agreia pratensis]|uniref:GNAT family N-acetyltransferase n=1 Tax=Microbacteriaceae TaxID=85023 RepID=UPI00188D2320|nr:MULTISPECIES: GNAT family protein [Microbacteriaceae]MBF4561221.1 GNAT family N-acetyltransferase [Microbacterium sp. VKM Ac-2870]MBF4633890.1 GNAT family N-acetyltransferase [Agreia pratensis]
MTDVDLTPPAPLDTVNWPLSTERLTLRRVSMADESSMWTYRGLEEVSRWGLWHAADQADWRSLLKERLRDALVIELNGHVIGDLMVQVSDAWGQREVAAAARNMQAELGWSLNPEYGGQGFATEAVREALRICFEDLNLHRVVAEAFAANESSCRLAERVGMRRELYGVRDSLHRDLGWIDGVGYALLADEWKAGR